MPDKKPRQLSIEITTGGNLEEEALSLPHVKRTSPVRSSVGNYSCAEYVTTDADTNGDQDRTDRMRTCHRMINPSTFRNAPFRTLRE